MREQAITKATVNLSKLDADLRGAFGAKVDGLKTAGEHVYVIWAAEPSAQDQAQAEALVKAHDPAQLTAAQQAEKTKQQARGAAKAKLATASWASVVTTINSASLPAQTRADLQFIVQTLHACAVMLDVTDTPAWY